MSTEEQTSVTYLRFSRRGFLALAASATTTTALAVNGGATVARAQEDTPEEDAAYIRFLERQSMLYQADKEDERISGKGVQWRNDYGKPEPTDLVKTASAWLLYYPGSVITKQDQSVIGAWADKA